MRLFGYARCGEKNMRQFCCRCRTIAEADPETTESACRQCNLALHWRFALPTQRERIRTFCDERFPDAERAGILCEVCNASEPLGSRPHLLDLIGHLREGDVIVAASVNAAFGRWVKADESATAIFEKGAGIAFAEEGVVAVPSDENSICWWDATVNAQQCHAYEITNPWLYERYGDVSRGRKMLLAPGHCWICRQCLLNGVRDLQKIEGTKCPTCGEWATTVRIPYPDQEIVSFFLTFQAMKDRGWGQYEINHYMRGVCDSLGRPITHNVVTKWLRQLDSLTPERLAKLKAETGAEPQFTGDASELDRLIERIRADGTRPVPGDGSQNAKRTQSLAEAWRPKRQRRVKKRLRRV